MELNIPSESYGEGIQNFILLLDTLLKREISDEQVVNTAENELRQIQKDCAAYIRQNTSEDITPVFIQLISSDNSIRIPGQITYAQKRKQFQDKVRNIRQSMAYLLDIISISDPLKNGRSYESERAHLSVSQKQDFLLLKLYEIRKTERQWSAQMLFDFNQVAMDTRGEGGSICKSLEKRNLIEGVWLGNGFSGKITTYGKSIVEEALAAQQQKEPEASTTELDIFISHSTQDAAAAKLLVELLKAAFNIPSKMIRCSSLDGYRLPAGVSTDEQLKKEVHGCKVLIGLISENSINSAYVLFELGARWGASKYLVPLLIDPASSAKITGPLKGLNALSARMPAQLHQVLDGIQQELDIEIEAPPIYGDQLDALVSYAAKGL